MIQPTRTQHLSGCAALALAMLVSNTPALADPATDADHCRNWNECLQKYETMLPEWRQRIIELGERFKQEIPQIEQDLNSLGEQSQEQLKQWIEELEKQLPEPQPAPDQQDLPERHWI